MIRILDGNNRKTRDIIDELNRPSQLEYTEKRNVVCGILEDIKKEGDRALLEYTNRFDGTDYRAIDEVIVSKDEIKQAYTFVSPGLLNAMELSVENIRRYHERQLQNSWVTFETDGVMLGQRITPLGKVGIYVPGGRASYPSSVLMNAIPAKVANVKEITMVTPPSRDGRVNPATLVAADLAGIDKIYKIGGAQAIAALSYGTETVKKVDKIVGPGNIYVTLAKKEVFGFVDIDMIAGPSEILIIADETANPAFIVADLLSQAEHDPMASSILVTDSYGLAEQVKTELYKQTRDISTRNTIEASLSQYGCIIIVDDIAKAAEVANAIAPEHLELMTSRSDEHLNLIENAGAIFVGSYSPEPVGDYIAGPNHVLPTSGTAKFYSPLGVDDFIKKSSIIRYTKEALSKTYKDIAIFARTEGFEAHARSVELRFD